MKIFSAEQIRQWDQYTMAHEPVSSLDLMERAALQCTNWITGRFTPGPVFHIYAGKGNNGGDGLAIARMLAQKEYQVIVSILEFGSIGTADFQTNLQRLHDYPGVEIRYIQSPDHFHTVPGHEIIIDALFGTGLNRSPEGLSALLMQHINSLSAPVIAIDIPSGLFPDQSSKNSVVINANHTLSFQQQKLAFLLPENDSHCGEIHILDIGLDKNFYALTPAKYQLTDKSIASSILKSRKKFSHKGNYGHAGLIVGSKEMMGAAVLSARACMRSGVGKLTCYIPECGYEIMQMNNPESMTQISGKDHIEQFEPVALHSAIGIGPGIGRREHLSALIENIFSVTEGTCVIDADALNIIASNNSLWNQIPASSVLTPHPKEFERLFGQSKSDFHSLDIALDQAKNYHCVIVLKGHYSFIACPDGNGFFNSSGNAGMATAGSGDVLTGMITGLLAQGYDSKDAAVLGVYLHGLAGDLAAAEKSQEAMIASDIINNIGNAYKALQTMENNPMI